LSCAGARQISNCTDHVKQPISMQSGVAQN
jgi:hypothetical protein